MFMMSLAFLSISCSKNPSVFSLYGSHRQLANPGGIKRYHLKQHLLCNAACCMIYCKLFLSNLAVQIYKTKSINVVNRRLVQKEVLQKYSVVWKLPSKNQFNFSVWVWVVLKLILHYPYWSAAITDATGNVASKRVKLEGQASGSSIESSFWYKCQHILTKHLCSSLN